MSDRIVPYVSYTKINVMHLSASFVDTKTKNSAVKQLGLPTGGKTHSNVWTNVEQCHRKQTGQTYLHKCVRADEISPVEFLSREYEAGMIINRVFIQFGLWWRDQRTVKQQTDQRGTLLVCL